MAVEPHQDLVVAAHVVDVRDRRLAGSEAALHAAVPFLVAQERQALADLRRSGLSDATIAEAGLYTAAPEDLWRLVGPRLAGQIRSRTKELLDANQALLRAQRELRAVKKGLTF